jgi:hypothetical protein
VGYKLTSYGYFNSNQCEVTGANGSLLGGGAVTQGAGSATPLPVTLEITGLKPGDTYKIIVYTCGGPSQLAYASLALTGGATFYFQTAEGDGVGGALTTLQNSASPANIFKSTAPGTPIPNPQTLKSNYIEFDNVKGSSAAMLTLTELGAWPNGAWTPVSPQSSHVAIGISGVQIIDTSKN